MFWAKVLEDIIDYVDGSNLQISLLFTLLHSAAACFTRLLLCIGKRKTIFSTFLAWYRQPWKWWIKPALMNWQLLAIKICISIILKELFLLRAVIRTHCMQALRSKVCHDRHHYVSTCGQSVCIHFRLAILQPLVKGCFFWPRHPFLLRPGLEAVSCHHRLALWQKENHLDFTVI